MWWPAIVGSAVTLAIACIAVAVAWGRINQGQQHMVDTMKLMAEELKRLPEVYVTVSLDKERQRLADERHMVHKELLLEIKTELKEIGRKRS